MKLLKTILILLGLAALLVGGFCAVMATAGRLDVSATGEHHTLTVRLFQHSREAAVSRGSRDVTVQMPDLNDHDLLYEAVVGFQDMCAACHTPPGGSPTALARGLNPPPTELADAARVRTPAELFWVTSHGIRMTGMPAWNPTHSDSELWPIVALITRFPDFAETDYANLLAAAREAGVEHHHHHDDDHSHDHGHGHDHGHDNGHNHDNDHNRAHEHDHNHAHDDGHHTPHHHDLEHDHHDHDEDATHRHNGDDHDH